MEMANALRSPFGGSLLTLYASAMPMVGKDKRREELKLHIIQSYLWVSILDLCGRKARDPF